MEQVQGAHCGDAVWKTVPPAMKEQIPHMGRSRVWPQNRSVENGRNLVAGSPRRKRMTVARGTERTVRSRRENVWRGFASDHGNYVGALIL
jgi:hypothetical protein